ncbi:MAG: SIMPL domain-containing protein [Anaerolineae bacterium]|nr:SIMPL domain-containing protein [Anaerolineae bacterium]
MKTKFFLLVLVCTTLIALASCSAIPSQPSDTQPPSTLNVTGIGKVYLTPDVAYISIGVRTKDENVATALEQNSKQAAAIAEAIKSFGVEDKYIQTTAFNIYPEPQYNEMGEQISTNYVVENTVYVTVRDLQKLGNLLDTVVRNGANNIYGIQFDVMDKTAALAEARKLAIQDAQKQAEELAQNAGIELGKVFSLNAYTSYPMPVYEGKMRDMGGIGGNVPTAAGQLVVQVDANISYIIK